MSASHDLDVWSNERHYAKHRLIYTEVLEAAADASWSWDNHPGHGWRMVGSGSTLRRKHILIFSHPNDDRFNCHEPLGDWETWDGPWVVVTAFPPR